MDDNFNRMKIKQESYFKLSHIINLKEVVIFDYILGKLELDAELLQYDRQVRDRVLTMKNTWEFVITEVELIYNKISSAQIRKDFAEKAMQYPFYSVLFRMYDGKSYVDKLKWEQVSRWEKCLKKTV